MDLLDVLTRSSVPVIEVAGWRTRERAGLFTPIAQLDHHTAAKATSTRPAPSLETCVKGRPDLAGPLCNQLVDYFGRCFLISDGRANDSGKGSSVVLDELRRGITPSRTAAERGLVDDADGNRWFWDTEVEYPGGQFSPNAAQLETLMRVNVGLALAGGGPPLGHKEWTRRKPDPANVDMVAWRREFDRRIDALAAMAAGTGPTVDAETSTPTSVVAHTTRHTLEGEPVMRHLVPVRLDDQGRGYTGPDEGLHIPYVKTLAVSGHGQTYAGRDGRYAGADAYQTEENGELVVSIENGDPHTTAFALVCVAD